MILRLLGYQIILLLLVLLVGLGVASVGCRGLMCFEIAGVSGRSRTRGDSSRLFLGLRSYRFFRRFSGGFFFRGRGVFIHRLGLGYGRRWRIAMVGRSA